MLSGGGITALGVADERNGPEESTVSLVVVNDESGEAQPDTEQPTVEVQAPARVDIQAAAGESKPSDFFWPGVVSSVVGGTLVVAGVGGNEREKQEKKNEGKQ
jgi:hypothetical protein